MAITRRSGGSKARKAVKSAGTKKGAARSKSAAKPAGKRAPARSKPVKAKKSVKPAKTTKASKSAKAAKSKKSTKSATPVKAAKPTKSATPAKAAKPAKPAKPVKPVKPAVAEKPGKFVKGVKPVVAKPVKGKAAPRPPAPVHPIGMLPASLIARSNAKPAVIVAHKPKPAARATGKPAPTQGVQSVTEQDMKEFEERLLAERQRILKEMGHLESTVFKVNQRESSGDLSGYAFHMADAGTDAMEREKAFLFASAEGRTLMEIDEALRRLYQGQYGVCESCGNPIGRARLQAIPHARLCVACKEKEERTGRGAM